MLHFFFHTYRIKKINDLTFSNKTTIAFKKKVLRRMIKKVQTLMAGRKIHSKTHNRIAVVLNIHYLNRFQEYH